MYFSNFYWRIKTLWVRKRMSVVNKEKYHVNIVSPKVPIY